MTAFPKADCRYFLGHKPCRFGGSCRGCLEYQPWQENILLIKTAAKGDVLRTTPLASALKSRYPRSRLTWVTAADAIPLLMENPDIDRLLDFGPGSISEVLSQRFDLAVCLDKEPQFTGLATMAKAVRKCGFGLNPRGQLIPLNRESKHLYDLGLSDRLKFKLNQKSYQQLVIEACGLKYASQPYVLNLNGLEISWARQYLNKFPRLRNRRFLVGINTGTGRAFPTKSWPPGHFVRLGRLLAAEKDLGLLLLGGPGEARLNQAIARQCRSLSNAGTGLNLRQFAAVIDSLDLVAGADTLGMHVGIARGRKTVALFGPTCSQEIDLYQAGEKLTAGVECAPCYKTRCPDPLCMKDISPETVRDSILRLLKE